MKIHFKSLGFDTGEALRGHVLRRLSAALAHLADRLGSVVVRFVDENGPRGGLDKICAISLEGPHLSPVVVRARAADCYTAADLAIRRAGRAGGRAFDRRFR